MAKDQTYSIAMELVELADSSTRSPETAMAFTQDNRHIAITMPLGKDVLLLMEFSGQEAMSQLFSFELHLLSEVDPMIKFDGRRKNVIISLDLPDDGTLHQRHRQQTLLVRPVAV